MSDRTRPLLIAAEGCAVNADLLDRHLDDLDPVVARRMIIGRSLSAADYCALLLRRDELQKRVQWRLRDIDALLTPTSMIPALPLSVIDENPETYAAYNGKYFRNTGLGNFLNLCGISVPCGFTRNGSPIGLMIYCKSFREDMALRVAYAHEQATHWRTRRPDLAWAETETPNSGMQPRHNARG